MKISGNIAAAINKKIILKKHQRIKELNKWV